MKRVFTLVLPIAVVVVLVMSVAAVVRNDLAEQKRSYKSNVGTTGLPSYRIAESIDVPIAEPFGISVMDDDRVVVCGNDAVAILNPDGNFTVPFSIRDQAGSVAAQDSSFIVLGMMNYITVLNADTGTTAEWALLDERSIITSVCIVDDEVYVADAGTRMVWRFSREGQLKGMIDGFIVPSPYFDIADNGDGSILVVDPGRHTVNQYDRMGAKLSSWGTYSAAIDGFGGCCNPTDISVDNEGNIVTSEKGILRIKRYTPDGTLVDLIANAENLPSYDAEIDVDIDSRGRIVVLYPSRAAILFLERLE